MSIDRRHLLLAGAGTALLTPAGSAQPIPNPAMTDIALEERSLADLQADLDAALARVARCRHQHERAEA